MLTMRRASFLRLTLAAATTSLVGLAPHEALAGKKAHKRLFYRHPVVRLAAILQVADLVAERGAAVKSPKARAHAHTFLSALVRAAMNHVDAAANTLRAAHQRLRANKLVASKLTLAVVQQQLKHPKASLHGIKAKLASALTTTLAQGEVVQAHVAAKSRSLALDALIGEEGMSALIGEEGLQALIGEEGMSALVGEDGSVAVNMLVGEDGMVGTGAMLSLAGSLATELKHVPGAGNGATRIRTARLHLQKQNKANLANVRSALGALAAANRVAAAALGN